MNTTTSQKNWKSTTRGILIIPALMFFLTPVGYVMVYLILPFVFGNVFRYPFDRYPTIHIGNMFLIILIGYLGYFYFNRKKIAPSLYIVLRILYFIYITVLIAVFYNQGIFDDVKNELYTSIAACLLFVSLFVYSKKVKEVFTEEITDSNMLERITAKAEPAFNKFFALLLTVKKWLIPLILLFCAALTILIFLLYHCLYIIFTRPLTSIG
jgi:hypothetical protein